MDYNMDRLRHVQYYNMDGTWRGRPWRCGVTRGSGECQAQDEAVRSVNPSRVTKDITVLTRRPRWSAAMQACTAPQILSRAIATHI